jgi:hypothetical protein
MFVLSVKMYHVVYLYFLTRMLRMKVMYTVLNADIPVMHIAVRIHILVKCVTKCSLQSAN